jgi:23S rRNA-/tRNA-specific pseudouridylate synthase
LCLGHPIVGDYTYNPWHRAAVVLGEIDETNIITTSGGGGGDDDDDGNDHDRREMYYSSADRMMLHAYQLR